MLRIVYYSAGEELNKKFKWVHEISYMQETSK